MDPKIVTDAVQQQLGIYGLALDNVTSSQLASNIVEVRGTINGNWVHIEAESDQKPADYEYTIWLYDADGEPVGRGNGGRTLQDAVSIYQWQSVAVRYR